MNTTCIHDYTNKYIYGNDFKLKMGSKINKKIQTNNFASCRLYLFATAISNKTKIEIISPKKKNVLTIQTFNNIELFCFVYNFLVMILLSSGDIMFHQIITSAFYIIFLFVAFVAAFRFFDGTVLCNW